jgi:2'-5' RNA ligase
MHALLLAAFGHAEERAFRPHVTLARLQGNERVIADEHPFNQTLSLTQRMETIALFKSPGNGEKGYEALVSVRSNGAWPRATSALALRRLGPRTFPL